MLASEEMAKLKERKFARNKETAASFMDAEARFQKLLERGIAKRRQNQIMPLEEQYRRKVKYNAN